uniref:Uncharacterized protein n=1 Tax=Arundo donax TaxID=35708 RepID=A0A0A9FTX6_ARUDO
MSFHIANLKTKKMVVTFIKIDCTHSRMSLPFDWRGALQKYIWQYSQTKLNIC